MQVYVGDKKCWHIWISMAQVSDTSCLIADRKLRHGSHKLELQQKQIPDCVGDIDSGGPEASKCCEETLMGG